MSSTHEEDDLTVQDTTSSCQEEGGGGREVSLNSTEGEPSIDSKTHCNSSATGKHTCIQINNDNLSGTSKDTPPPLVSETSDEDRTDGHHYQGVGVQVVAEDGPGPARSDRKREERVTQEEGIKMCSYTKGGVCGIHGPGDSVGNQSTDQSRYQMGGW